MTNTPSLPPGGEKQDDQVEAVALEAFWNEMCPGIRRTAGDDAHYRPAIRAALSSARPLILEVAAKAVEPMNDKPCGCIVHLDEKWWCQYCDCGNGGDQDEAQSWCTSMNEAVRIRALKESPSEGGGG